MYKFLYYLWIRGKISKDRIINAETKGLITVSEKEDILNTPKI